MTFLYITADQIDHESGGGRVTREESEALKLLGPCEVWGRDDLQRRAGSVGPHEEPWVWDLRARSLAYSADRKVGWPIKRGKFSLAHFYAGTFSGTVKDLKESGCKVTYTAAAHDVAKSRAEHEKLGIPYNYPHLTDPELWKRYLAGYLAADILICPSQHSAAVMRSFGATNQIEVIPHGVDLPATTAPLPKSFVCGYLGAAGPDKGLRYLLEAWENLKWWDATLLLAGRDSTSEFVTSLIDYFCPTMKGSVSRMGWVDKVSDFYNQISLYIQPSVSEGWGCEVGEAMAHGRGVVCSDGAGACDMVPAMGVVPAADADQLAERMNLMRRSIENNMVFSTAKTYPVRGGLKQYGDCCRDIAEDYIWGKVCQRYVNLWTDMLAATKN